MKPLQIGKVELPNPLMLAPMAGVTDLPYRLLCKEQGCGLLYTEMISAKALCYMNKNTEALLQVDPREHPIAGQLFGSEPEILREAAKKLEAEGLDIIDINMGCPVPKVVNNQEGSALMKDPRLVASIVEAVVSGVQIPVTVKIRKGFDVASVNAVEIARVAEESGASAIAVHGRTREQFYSGKADWSIIKAVKSQVQIPVIGNGDIFSPEDAVRMFRETGCDGIMIARGARGNPWIFSRTLHYLDTGALLPLPTPDIIRDMALRHGRLLEAHKSTYTALREMRKHISWYTTGYPNSARLRNAINQAEDFKSLESLLHKFAEGE